MNPGNFLAEPKRHDTYKVAILSERFAFPKTRRSGASITLAFLVVVVSA